MNNDLYENSGKPVLVETESSTKQNESITNYGCGWPYAITISDGLVSGVWLNRNQITNYYTCENLMEILCNNVIIKSNIKEVEYEDSEDDFEIYAIFLAL